MTLSKTSYSLWSMARHSVL